MDTSLANIDFSANTAVGPWLTIPESNSPLAALTRNLEIVNYAIHQPNHLLVQVTQKTLANTSSKLSPHIKNAFQSSFKDSFYFSGNFFVTKSQELFPYILCALKTSKLALQLMLSDLFEAFISPLAQNEENISLPLNGAIAASMIGVSLLTHQLAKKHLQEDPEQALSITYGAITGTLASYIMDHDIFIGTLTGASVGLIADTGVSYIRSGSAAIFFKDLYKKFEIQEKAEKIQKFTSQIFPYITYTLGTALVYSRISPIITKVMEEEIPSQKLHVIKVIAASGMLFGMGKSYLSPLLKSFLFHIKLSVQSARDTGTIVSWTPRVLSILCITSLISSKKS